MRHTRRLSLLLVTMLAAVLVAGGIALAAVIDGGPGDNTLRGTENADTIRGNDGNDTIYGMAGDDEVDGGNDQDILYGGNEARTLAGNDRVLGRAGNDRVVGGPGADVLHGGPGNDALFAGPKEDASVDRMYGVDGDDRFYAVDGTETRDIIDCGAGRDEVRADPTDQVAANCENVQIVRGVVIDLSQEGTVEQALQLARSVNSNAEELVARYQVGDDEYTVGYVLDENDSSPTAAQVTEEMVSAFQEDEEMLRESSLPVEETATPDGSTETPDQTTGTPEQELADEEAIANDLSSVVNSLQSNGAKIDAMTVQTATALDQIQQEPGIESTLDTSTLPSDPSAEPDNDFGSTRWAPKRGIAETGCCAGPNNRRFVYSRFEWNSWRLGNLKSKNTRPWYEADNLYNTERGTYLTRRIKHWSSNLPRSYRDTTRFDRVTSPDVLVLTVGSLGVERLKPYKSYYTSIRTKWGNQSSDGAGANAQYGKREWEHCTGSAWCTGTTYLYAHSDRLIGLGYYRAPGKGRWFSRS